MLLKSYWSFLSVALFSLCTLSLQADVVISYGVVEGGVRFIDLDGNRADQAINFFVSGGDSVDGLELNLQIRDGGAALGGTATGPVLGDIDLITGTIFAGASPTQIDVVNTPLAKQSTVDTTSLVSANGKIATVLFDTTGFGPGLYEFRLTVSAQAGTFPTTFYNGVNTVNTTAPNGFIRVIPEPASWVLLAGCSALVSMRRRRVLF